MFDGLKKKLVSTAKAEAIQEIRRSSNEGRIRTASVIVEGLLLLGLILLSSKGGGSAAQSATTVILNNCNIIVK